MTSALAIKARLIGARPASFSGCVSSSVSNDCKRKCQRRSALQDLLRADEPEGRVLREALGVVDILVARQSAVYRLPHEVGQTATGCCFRVRPSSAVP